MNIHKSEYPYPANILEDIGFSEKELKKRSGDPSLSISVGYILQTLNPVEQYVLYAYYFYNQTLNKISTDIDKSLMTTTRIRDCALRKFLQPDNMLILTVGLEGYYEREIQKAFDSGKSCGNRLGYMKGMEEGYQKGFQDAVSKYYELKQEDAKNLPNMSVTNLALPTGVKNVLKEMGIKTLRELAMAYPDEFVQQEGIGAFYGVEIARFLRTYGIAAPLWTDVWRDKYGDSPLNLDEGLPDEDFEEEDAQEEEED